ncbi:MAG: hypothetical protein ACFUZC_16465 [Chthoniobacteraceae bacterium]
MKVELDRDEIFSALMGLRFRLQKQLGYLRVLRKKDPLGKPILSLLTYGEERKILHAEALLLRRARGKMRAAYREGSVASLRYVESVTVPVPAPMPLWKKGEPPRDRDVVIIANLMAGDDSSVWCEPVCTRARWSDEAEDWVFVSNGLVIRQCLEDKLIIHWWADVPSEEPRHDTIAV